MTLKVCNREGERSEPLGTEIATRVRARAVYKARGGYEVANSHRMAAQRPEACEARAHALASFPPLRDILDNPMRRRARAR